MDEVIRLMHDRWDAIPSDQRRPFETWLRRDMGIIPQDHMGRELPEGGRVRVRDETGVHLVRRNVSLEALTRVGV